jgi:hypothetical protein
MSTDDIELARTGRQIVPAREAVARFTHRVIETPGHVSDPCGSGGPTRAQHEI